MEKEIKLLSTSLGRRRIFSLPPIKKTMIAGSRRTLALWNEYYDTEDQKLTRAGIAYRVRRTNREAYEATIKTRGYTAGGFSARGEYTVPLAGPDPVLTGFSNQMDMKLETLLADEELHGIVTIEFIRKTALLQLSAGTVVELAVDSGLIRAGGKKMPIEEIEVELKKGSERDLMRFVADLSETVPLYPEERSKFRRGLDLLGVPAGSPRPVATVLSPEGPFDAGWRSLMRALLFAGLDRLTAAWKKEEKEGNRREKPLYPYIRNLTAFWAWGEPFLARVAWHQGNQKLEKLLSYWERAGLLEEAGEGMDALSGCFDPGPLVLLLRREQSERLQDFHRDLMKGETASVLWRLLADTYSRTVRNPVSCHASKVLELQLLDWYRAARETDGAEIQAVRKQALTLTGFLIVKAAWQGSLPARRFFREAETCLENAEKAYIALLLSRECWQKAHNGKILERRLALAALSGYAFRRGEKHRQKVRKAVRKMVEALEKKRLDGSQESSKNKSQKIKNNI